MILVGLGFLIDNGTTVSASRKQTFKFIVTGRLRRRQELMVGRITGKCTLVVIFLQGSLGVCVVKSFHNLERGVVVSGVVQGQITVIVLLSGTFGVNLQQEFSTSKGPFFQAVKCKARLP